MSDRRLLRQARAGRAFLMAATVLGLAGAALIIAQAALLAYCLAAVFQDGLDLTRLDPAPAWLAAVVVGRAVVAWAREVVSHRAAAAVKAELRGRLLAHVAALGPGWLRGERSGEITALATRGLDALDGYFARYLPQLILAAGIPLAILAFVLPTDLIAGLTILVTVPLIPVFMALVGHATRRLGERQSAQLGRLSHHLLELLAGLATSKAFGRTAAQATTIEALTDEQRRVTMRSLRLASLSSLVLELLATLSVALVAVGVGLRVVGGSLDLRTALLVLILAPEAYLPLRQLGTHYHASAEGVAAAGAVFAVLETPLPPTGTRTDLPDFPGLRLTGITVEFPGRAAAALEDFSLRLNQGDVVALTGPSGCGKSTVLSVILGFVPAATGQVAMAWDELRGVDLGEVGLAEADPAAWRSRIAWVPQRPYLFTGTVADNIRLGQPDRTHEQVRQAARSARAEDILSTVVGEGGTGLSTGQRQRVALARAFLRDAPVVLLDEPTANLDPATEADLIAAIGRLAEGRTVLLVAHRPALLGVADRIVAMTAPGVRPATGAVAARP
jgi:thiol reductant ABC exporter CydD subunit